MKHAQDHFSSIAPQYAQGRIGYPEALYRFLRAQCSSHVIAWDCATGSGQAALSLASQFSKVVATDISKELLSLAPAHPRILYREAPAEESGIETSTVDLITVAQALHWFDLPRFWTEVARVLKKDGILAFWGYNWPLVDTRVDGVLDDFKNAIASFWPVRSAILHEGYRSIQPPFKEIASPPFQAEALWNLEDYLLHLRSWSATRYYYERAGEDAVVRFKPAFRSAWSGERVTIRWPLVVRAFVKE